MRIPPTLIVLFLLSAPTAAQVRYVDAARPSGGSGLSWSNAYRELRTALDAAQIDPTIHEIWVARGTYVPDPGGSNRLKSFALRSDLALYGGFAGGETSLAQRDITANPTVLSGDLAGDDGPAFANYADNSSHVVTAVGTTTTAVLDGVTVRGGAALDGLGGGIHAFGGTATLRNVSVKENRTVAGFNNGGGLHVHGTQPFFATDCSFSDNRSTGGGAVALRDTSATFTRCSFLRNHATGGAGVAVANDQDVSVEFHECVFQDNTGTDGGGIELTGIDGGTLTLEGCRFEGNAVTTGGGLSLSTEQAPLVRIRATLFRGNRATSGSGISVEGEVDPDLLVEHCRFEDNQDLAVQGGAAVDLHRAASIVDSRFVRNSGGAVNVTSVDIVPLLVFFERCEFVGASTLLRVDRARAVAGLLECTLLATDPVRPAIRNTRNGQVELQGCIVWGALGTQIEGGGPVSATYSDVRLNGLVLPGTGNLDLDPLFVAAAAGDARLTALSPCIDAGRTGLLVAGADLDLDSRMVDGDLDGRVVIDMGSDEFSPVHLTIQGTPAPGATLTLTTSGAARPVAFLGIAPPGIFFRPSLGTLFFDAGSPEAVLLAWPATPSTRSITVPPGVPSELFHLQVLTLGGGAFVQSNYVPLAF